MRMSSSSQPRSSISSRVVGKKARAREGRRSVANGPPLRTRPCYAMAMTTQLYLRQLLVGRDIGRGNMAGKQMQNFVYLIGDRGAGECLVVDPAWDIEDIVDRAAEDGLKITGALVTHYHPDHIGGSFFGFDIEGLRRLLELSPCPIHVHKNEA